MEEFEEYYAEHAAEYDLLVSHEDYRGTLLPGLRRLGKISGAQVVELGAGTGRLSVLIAPIAASLCLFDASAHMLDVARRKLADMGLSNWTAETADNRSIPLADSSADLVLSGWSIGYLAVSCGNTWKSEVRKAVEEMLRLGRSGGKVIILETLGTGTDQAAPPSERLGRYYELLEGEYAFSREEIRTDYRFSGTEEADRILRPFFGDDLTDFIFREQKYLWSDDGLIIPECTGIWHVPA